MIRRYISRTLQNYILLNIHKERMSSNRSFDIDRIYSNMVNALWIVLLPFEFAIMSILSHLFGPFNIGIITASLIFALSAGINISLVKKIMKQYKKSDYIEKLYRYYLIIPQDKRKIICSTKRAYIIIALIILPPMLFLIIVNLIVSMEQSL